MFSYRNTTVQKACVRICFLGSNMTMQRQQRHFNGFKESTSEFFGNFFFQKSTSYKLTLSPGSNIELLIKTYSMLTKVYLIYLLLNPCINHKCCLSFSIQTKLLIQKILRKLSPIFWPYKRSLHQGESNCP